MSEFARLDVLIAVLGQACLGIHHSPASWRLIASVVDFGDEAIMRMPDRVPEGHRVNPRFPLEPIMIRRCWLQMNSHILAEVVKSVLFG